VFRLNVTAHVLFVAVGWALGIGLLGGSLSAWRAIQMRVATALRPS
jgi:ABC-type antimicrobial peptide transport system permease subunit